MRGSAVLFVACLACAACGKQAIDPPPASAAMEVVVGDPVTVPPIASPVRPEPTAPATGRSSAADSDLASDPLPATWSGPIVPGLAYDEAMKKAHDARDGYGRLLVPGASAKPEVVKTWFRQALPLVDQASRMYAAAFHAADAPREGRIEAIAEAAELDMTMARGLDEAGLASLPAAWRADPAIATTFEDIAVGPTRRWRDEARVLARQCLMTANESNVSTDAARRCAALRTGAPQQKTAKRGTDAGAPCACAAGDPLCSASLGGWCPKN